MGRGNLRRDPVNPAFWQIDQETPFGYASGAVEGVSTVHKFGKNPVLSNSEAAIWSAGGQYNFLDQAQPVFVISGGNAADASAGAGARTVTVLGLGADWGSAEETLTLNGGTQSSVTTTQFTRVFRAFVAQAGTYGGVNTGAISIAGTVASGVVGHILAAAGQSQLAIYTVPSGHTGYLTRIDVNVAGTKAANVRMYQRQRANVVAGDFGSQRVVWDYADLTGDASGAFESYPSFPQMTDIWIAGEKTSAGTAATSAVFNIILKKG